MTVSLTLGRLGAEPGSCTRACIPAAREDVPTEQSEASTIPTKEHGETSSHDPGTSCGPRDPSPAPESDQGYDPRSLSLLIMPSGRAVKKNLDQQSLSYWARCEEVSATMHGVLVD